MPAYVPDEGDIVWLQFDAQAGHEQAGHQSAIVLSHSDDVKARMASATEPLP